MRLSRLRIENIRSYVEAEVEFRDGVTLFEGDIGSGKSTVLLAIEFALFGLAYTKSTHLLRRGTKTGKVELELEVGGSRVRILRTLKGTGKRANVDRCVLDLDGEAKEMTPVEMQPAVLKLLGYDEDPSPRSKPDIFRYAVYTPQEDMRTILDTRTKMNTERKNTLRTAFGIDEYRRALDNLDPVTSKTSALAEGNLREASSISDVEQRLERLDAQLGERARGLDELKRGLDEAVARERLANGEISRLEEMARTIKEVDDRHKTLLTTVANLRADIKVTMARLETAQGLENELGEVQTQLRDLSGLREELTKLKAGETALATLRERFQAVQLETIELRSRLKRADEADVQAEAVARKLMDLRDPGPETRSLSDSLKELSRVGSELLGERISLEREHATIVENVEELKTLEDEAICPRCQQPLDDEHLDRLLEVYKKDRSRLMHHRRSVASKLTKNEDGKAKIDRELKAATQRMEGWMVAQRDLERLRCEAAKGAELKVLIEASDLERLARELGEAETSFDGGRLEELTGKVAKRDHLEERRATLSGAIGEVPSLRRSLKALSKELANAEKGLSDAKAELDRLQGDLDENDARRARSEHNDAIKALERIRAGIDEATSSIHDIEANIRGERSILEKLLAKRELGERYLHLHRWLKDCFSPSLVAIETRVMEMIREDMNAAAKDWFELLVDDPDLELSIVEDFVPQVDHQGWGIELTALSGGERTAVAFAYRLALNGLVKRYATAGQETLLMLDEPTDGFSREQLRRMGNVLSEVDAKQIIIVSHDRELEDLADVVYLVAKVEGVSTVTLAVG